jgi:hypothetical protein
MATKPLPAKHRGAGPKAAHQALVTATGIRTTAAVDPVNAQSHTFYTANTPGIFDRGLPVRGVVQRPQRYIKPAPPVGVAIPVPGGIARHLAAGGT